MCRAYMRMFVREFVQVCVSADRTGACTQRPVVEGHQHATSLKYRELSDFDEPMKN